MCSIIRILYCTYRFCAPINGKKFAIGTDLQRKEKKKKKEPEKYYNLINETIIMNTKKTTIHNIIIFSGYNV